MITNKSQNLTLYHSHTYIWVYVTHLSLYYLMYWSLVSEKKVFIQFSTIGYC